MLKQEQCRHCEAFSIIHIYIIYAARSRKELKYFSNEHLFCESTQSRFLSRILRAPHSLHFVQHEKWNKAASECQELAYCVRSLSSRLVWSHTLSNPFPIAERIGVTYSYFVCCFAHSENINSDQFHIFHKSGFEYLLFPIFALSKLDRVIHDVLTNIA